MSVPVPIELLLAPDAEHTEPELLLVLLDDLLELLTLLEILELLSELLTLLDALLAEDMLLELCCDDELETEDITELVLTLLEILELPISPDEELDGFAASPPLQALNSRHVMESTITR